MVHVLNNCSREHRLAAKLGAVNYIHPVAITSDSLGSSGCDAASLIPSGEEEGVLTQHSHIQFNSLLFINIWVHSCGNGTTEPVTVWAEWAWAFVLSGNTKGQVGSDGLLGSEM